MPHQGRHNQTGEGHRAPDPRSREARDAMSRSLEQLGSESSAERRAKLVVPWIATFGLHAFVVALGFVITWSVAMYRGEEPPVQVVADFYAMNYEPVVELNPEEDVVDLFSPVMDDASLLEFDHPLPDPFSDRWAEPVPSGPNPITPPALDFSTTAVEGSATFMGVSASNAQRVVYVIDASGSMIAYLQFILHELTKSLDALSEQQSFGIVFFQSNQALAVPPRRLSAVSRDQIRRALDWTESNVIPRGRSNPIPAIEAALRMQPDVVFILSVNITGAGHYEVDQRDLLARLEQLNPRDHSTGQRRTQINCIQFLDPDPLDTMRLIADEHGGPRGYKFLSRQELGLTAR
jgi:hypothetical protein